MTNNLNKQLGTTEILWNLDDLYSAIDDPEIEQDIIRAEKDAQAVKQQYAGQVATLTDEQLLILVGSLEKLAVTLSRLSTFAFLNFTTQTQNSYAAGFLQKITETLSRISKEIIFFELEWGKLDEEKANILLKSTNLLSYRHYLQNMRRYAKHLLSHVEETLLLEKAPVGSGSWTNLFEKVMGKMKFGKNGRSEEEVLTDLYNVDRKIRQQAASDLSHGLNSHLHILTHIMNTLLADKMIDDRLRKHDSWLSSMNLYNELRNDTVETLVETVVSRYDIPQRYYHLKRKMLNVDELTDYDRYAPLPHLPDTLVSWQDCQQMVLAAFNDFSPGMAEIAALFFQKQWIHAPLYEGKRGGAFAHPCVPDVHPYVMVNYTGNLRDVSTVAHELGHGIHQYLAAERGYYNSSTTLVLSETASVFAELLLFNSQLDLLLNMDERRAFTCQKLESIFATVFRQVSMNRFEHLIHNERRQKGELSSEALSKHWLTTQKAMFDDAVNLSDDYGVWWSYIPHFLSTPGYVYSYAFGELLVLALYNIYQQEGESFVSKYTELLSSGGNGSPYELLKPFGVNLDDPKFWHGGLTMIDELLASVE